MVSHIDSDHVAGMVDFAGELVTEKEDSKPLSYAVGTLWHNSFDDILGNDAEDLRTAAVEVLSRPVDDRVADEVAPPGGGRGERGGGARAAPASREARLEPQRAIRRPGRPAGGGRAHDHARAAEADRRCPHAAQLKRLHDKWEEWLEEHPKAVANPASAAAGRDNSPYNLSSIVVLAECDGKTMLLTGDARDDHVLAGLDETAIAKDGKTHVDILKLPHHGSIRNMRPEFFDRVTADHYVISANGRDGNPETDTLELIAAGRPDDDFTIHLTNRVGTDDLKVRLDAFLAAKAASGRAYGIEFRAENALSLRIDLLEAG